MSAPGASGRSSEELRALLHRDRYPRSSKYDPQLTAGMAMGPNVLWCTEALCEVLSLEPGMRVLDLGCGHAVSSIFLAKEFGVTVWAVDLITDPTENQSRVASAGLSDRVFPLKIDANALPFPDDYFDAVVSVGAYMYFGTDDTYLRRLVRHMRTGAQLGIVLHGLTHDIPRPPEAEMPPYFKLYFETFHTPKWWTRHWARTDLVDVEQMDLIADATQDWASFYRVAIDEDPRNRFLLAPAMKLMERDRGENYGLIRGVARVR